LFVDLCLIGFNLLFKKKKNIFIILHCLTLSF